MRNDSTPAAAAGQWTFGGTTTVNRLGLGAMRLPARGHDGPPVRRADALAVLRRAIELGVDHIDTAAFYRYGEVSANDLIREALHPYPADLVIATKVGPILGPRGFAGQGTAADLPAEVARNLRELRVECLDLVYLRVGGLSVVDESVAERFAALAELRAAGLIRHLGLSNITAAQLAEARRIAPVAAVQNLYHVAEPADAELADACAAQGIGYVPFFPLGGHRVVDGRALTRVAARHGASVPQIALAWLLDRAPNVLPIPGTSQPEHVAENVAAAAIRLDERDLADLSISVG